MRNADLSLALGAAMLVLVVAIGWAVQRGWTAGLDRDGLLAMARIAGDGWWCVSRLGDTVTRGVIAGVAVAWLVLRRRFAPAGWLALAGVGGTLLNSLAKGIATRPRPGLLPHREAVDTFSFPSGHSAGTMALWLALALWVAPARYRRPALAAALIVALLVGLSRMAQAVHWPSDVVAGWLEGAGLVLLLHGLAGRRAAAYTSGHEQGDMRG